MLIEDHYLISSLGNKKQLFDIALMNETHEFKNNRLVRAKGPLAEVAYFIYSDDKGCLSYRSRMLKHIKRDLKEIEDNYETIKTDVLQLARKAGRTDNIEKYIDILIDKTKKLERKLVHCNIPCLVAETPQIENTLFLQWKNKSGNLASGKELDPTDYLNFLRSFKDSCLNGRITLTPENINSTQPLDLQKIMGNNVVLHAFSNIKLSRKHYIGNANNIMKRNGEEFDRSDLKAMKLESTSDIVTSDTCINKYIKQCYIFDSIFFRKRDDKSKNLFYSIIEWLARKRTKVFVDNIGTYYSAFKNNRTSREAILNYSQKNTINSNQMFVSESKMFEYEDNNDSHPKKEYKDRLVESEKFLDFCYDILRTNGEYDLTETINAICGFCFNTTYVTEKSKPAAFTYLVFNEDYKSINTHKSEVFYNQFGDELKTHLTDKEKELLNSTLVQDKNQFVLTARGIERFKILVNAIHAVGELEYILELNGYTICDLPLTYYMKYSIYNTIDTVSGFLTSSYYKNNVAYEQFFRHRYRTLSVDIKYDEDILKEQYIISKKEFENINIDSNSIKLNNYQRAIKNQIEIFDDSTYKISDVCDIALLEILELMFPETFDRDKRELNINRNQNDFMTANNIKNEFAKHCTVGKLKTILGIIILIYRYLSSSITHIEDSNGAWRSKYQVKMESDKNYWYTYTSSEIENIIDYYGISEEDIFFSDKDNNYEVMYTSVDGIVYNLTEFLLDKLENKYVNRRDTVYRNFFRKTRNTTKIYEVSDKAVLGEALEFNNNIDIAVNLYRSKKPDLEINDCIDLLCKFKKIEMSDLKDKYLSGEYQSTKILKMKYEYIKEESLNMTTNLQSILKEIFFGVSSNVDDIPVNQLLLYEIQTNEKETLDYAVMKGKSYLYNLADIIVDKLNTVVADKFKNIPYTYYPINSETTIPHSNYVHLRHIMFICGDDFIDYDNRKKRITKQMEVNEQNLKTNTEILIREYNATQRLVTKYDKYNNIFTDTVVKKYSELDIVDSKTTNLALENLTGLTAEDIINKYSSRVLLKYRLKYASKSSIEFLRSIAPFNFMVIRNNPIETESNKDFLSLEEHVQYHLRNSGYFEMNKYISYGVSKIITPKIMYNIVNKIIDSVTTCNNDIKDLENFVYSSNAKRIKIELLSSALEMTNNMDLIGDYVKTNDDLTIADRRVCELLLAERSYKAGNFETIRDLIYNLSNKCNYRKDSDIKTILADLDEHNIIVYSAPNIKLKTEPRYVNAIKRQVYELVKDAPTINKCLDSLKSRVDQIRTNTINMLGLNNFIADNNTHENEEIMIIKGLFKIWKPYIERAIEKQTNRGLPKPSRDVYDTYLARYNEDKSKYDTTQDLGIIFNKRTNCYVAYFESDDIKNRLAGGKLYILHRTGFVIIIDDVYTRNKSEDNIVLTSISSLKDSVRKMLENR